MESEKLNFVGIYFINFSVNISIFIWESGDNIVSLIYRVTFGDVIGPKKITEMSLLSVK